MGGAELYFQNAFYIVTKLLGFYTEVERTISDGRIDMVAKTKDYIYIFEFKYDQSPDAALRQIDEKGYAEPFAAAPPEAVQGRGELLAQPPVHRRLENRRRLRKLPNAYPIRQKFSISHITGQISLPAFAMAMAATQRARIVTTKKTGGLGTFPSRRFSSWTR